MKIKGNFPSSFHHVDSVIEQIFSQIEEKGLYISSDKLMALHFAMRELFNNAIEHGNKLDENKVVSYKIIISDKHYEAWVYDNGSGYDLQCIIDQERVETSDRQRNRGILALYDMGFKMNAVPGCVKIRFSLADKVLMFEEIDPPGHVLIVDDVSMNRKLIKVILEKIDNISILEANDGYKALEIIKSKPISVVILDLMMPGMDGLQVLTRIKENPATQNISVIMCSAVSEINMIEDALTLGALDYFMKPLTDEQMRITLPLKVKNAIAYYNNSNKLVHFYQSTKEEIQQAKQIQEALITQIEDYGFAKSWGRYIPCDEVGGDVFCTKNDHNTLWFMIADISGHGIAAAMLSTMMSVLFSLTIEMCERPNDLLNKMNSKLYDLLSVSKYGLISAFVGCICGETLFWSNAGHPYPFLCKKDGLIVQELNSNGFLLGMFEEGQYTLSETQICEGDVAILYTDGLFDNGTAGGFAMWKAVREYCEDHNEELFMNQEQFIEDIINHFSDNGESRFIDDVAVMLVKKES